MKGFLFAIFALAALALLVGRAGWIREYPTHPKRTLLIAALAGLVLAFWILHHWYHHF
ncbi:hypothetical protein [Mailhella massiliensis]|uniref:Uncharacterized protein n=1 Tax=Mailhella massiliensis TaxID=1903261 RepID=A0A921AVW6_9BACT|nr:hypothetical protein [Mailhella massiliensis]HJD97059.1 hypothetical protein [Mailhella massiliensis]